MQKALYEGLVAVVVFLQGMVEVGYCIAFRLRLPKNGKTSGSVKCASFYLWTDYVIHNNLCGVGHYFLSTAMATRISTKSLCLPDDHRYA